MRQVGCRFRMEELDPQAWSGLIALENERARMGRLVDAAKEKVAESRRPTPNAAEATAMQKARTLSGAPPLGGSILPQSRPIK